MKRFIFMALLAVSVLQSIPSAYATQVSARTYGLGYAGYKLQLVNHSSYYQACEVSATNGAYYQVIVPPRSVSGWMKINDYNAIYSYTCVPR